MTRPPHHTARRNRYRVQPCKAVLCSKRHQTATASSPEPSDRPKRKEATV